MGWAGGSSPPLEFVLRGKVRFGLYCGQRSELRCGALFGV